MLDYMDENNKNPQKKIEDASTPALNNFSRDLTKLAQEGKLDPVIGRDKEIVRIAQILSRRKKNNPVLVGEPGCLLGDMIIEVEKISNDNSHKIETM
jgi:ATP-dependent Clp protease ATP-binding subunit ClpC